VRESGKVNFIDMPAIIDTGFDGFVQIDLQMAIALGWLAKKVNLGVTRVADGKLIPVGLFNSPVMIGQDTVVGLCQFPISKNAPCLVGMDLLRRAGRILVISKDSVLLPKEEDVNLSGA